MSGLRALGLLVALGVVSVVTGCGPLMGAPPADPPASLAPSVDPDVAAAKGIVRVRVPRLARDSSQRHARQLTVRVRNLSCGDLGTGSGFAIDASTLITNRHVVEGAERLEVNLSDGRTLNVQAAEVGVLGDVAFVTVEGTLPVTADLTGTSEPGSEVAAVGYPQGGRLTISPGTIIDSMDGYQFNVPGQIVRTTAEVEPGNSGGPLLDAEGRVAGVIYAVELATGFSLAIPMSTVDQLLSQAGTQPVTDCRSY